MLEIVRNTLVCTTLCMLSIASSAQTAASPDWGISGNLRFATQYVTSAGYHMSNERPVIQGIVDVWHKSGLWGELWTSSYDPDAIHPSANGIEVDLMAGYTHDFTDTLSGFAILGWYIFPGSHDRTEETDSRDYEFGIKWKFLPTTSISLSTTRDFGELSSYKSLSYNTEIAHAFGHGITAHAGISYTRPDNSTRKEKTRWFARIKKSFADGKYDVDLRYIDTNRNDSNYYDPAWIMTFGFNF